MEHYCHLETEVMALYSKKKWEQKNIFLDNLFKKLKMKNFGFKKCSNISMDFVAKLGHFYRILPPAPNLPPLRPQIPVMPDIVTIVTPFVMSLPFVG